MAFLLLADTDVRFRLTEILLNEEREYGALLGSSKELYGGPLKKLSCLAEEEHQLLFEGLAKLSEVSKDLCNQVGTFCYITISITTVIL